MWKSKIRLYLRYIIGLSVIAALVYHVQSRQDIIPVLSQFDISVLFPTLMIIVVHLLCLFTLWRRIILDLGQINSGNRLLIHSFLGGRTLGFITPGQTGELLKGMFFTSGIRLKGTSLSLIYAGYGMLVRTILGCIASIYFILKIPILFEVNINALSVFIIIFLLGMIVLILVNKVRIMWYFDRFFPAQAMDLIHIFKLQLQRKSFSPCTVHSESPVFVPAETLHVGLPPTVYELPFD